MTALMMHLLSLSVKVALLGGIVWIQLFLLRRAPAASRSRLCAVALAAIALLIVGEALAPAWLIQSPQITISVAAAPSVPAAAPRTSLATIATLAAGGLWILG